MGYKGWQSLANNTIGTYDDLNKLEQDQAHPWYPIYEKFDISEIIPDEPRQ